MNTLYIKINGYVFRIHFDDICFYNKMKKYLSEYIYDTKRIDNISEIDIYINSNGYSEIEKNFIDAESVTVDTFEKEKKIKYSDSIYSTLDKRYFIEYVNPESLHIYYDKDRIKLNDLIYIIREIYVRLQENNYSLFMHGSTVSIDKNGILILGSSGSGKTSLMYKLLSEGNEFVSNDRTFLTIDDYLEYFPIPIITSVGSLLNYDKLRKHIILKSDYRKNIIHSGKTEAKFPITSLELSELPNLKMLGRVPLSAIIIPKINLDDRSVFDIQKCTSFSQIKENCFTPTDSESLRKPWIYKRNASNQELDTYANERIEYLLDNYPIYLMKFSTDIEGEKIQEKILKLRR